HLLLVMGPPTLVIGLFAGPFLQLWLGEEFATNATTAFQLLAVGMLLNGLSQVPATLLDGVGRPDLRAKVFLGYVWVYVVVTWLLIAHMGIVGAGLAWALRGAIELVCFTAVASRALRFRADGLRHSGVGRGLLAFGGLAAVAVVFTAAEPRTWLQMAGVLAC